MVKVEKIQLQWALEKILCVSGPTWVKPVVFEGHLYSETLSMAFKNYKDYYWGFLLLLLFI